MFTPRILLGKRLDLAAVTIACDGYEWNANAAYDACVADAWMQRQREAAAARLSIWDGINYRVVNAEALERCEGSVHLVLGTIRYRYIATLRLLQNEHAKHALDPLYHLTTAALICTSDDWYVFGRRAGNGSVDLIGGGAQPDELEVAAGTDLERNLVKEIGEEIGIGSGDLRRIACIGVLLSSTSNVLVLSKADLTLTKREVERAFGDRSDDEMAEPVFVRPDELAPFLRSLTDYRALIPTLLEDA